MDSGIDWINSHFPESLYLPQNHSYYDEVACGYDFIQDKTVLVCGVCKNIGSNVRPILAKIRRLGEMFKSYEVFVYENDSTDKTVANLAYYSKLLDLPITIQTEKLNLEPHEQDKSLYRRQIMAGVRNKYLDFLKGRVYDYVIVLDWDIQGFSYQGVAHSFSCEFDVMGSNGIIYQTNKEGRRYRCFYDTWAYRGEGAENLNLLEFNRGEPVVEVDSCFGGLAIYKRELLDGVRYTEEDCDHVTLHKNMNVKLNPSQIVIYGE